MRNIPIIPFFPFFGAAIRRERQTGFLYPEFGNSSTKGAFLKIPFFWAISDSQDLTVALDTYTRRGVGGEGEYRYIMSERARGSASGFLIPEFLRDSQDRERLGIPLVRGFGSAKHDWQITPRLSFKLDANATTDDQVYRDYGDRLGDRARQFAETNVFLSQRWDAFSLTANVLWYQDLTTPAATELQRTPEIKFFGVRQPIPGLPGFLYETEASLTNFYRVVGDSGLRIDLHPRAYYPIPVAGLFTVTPFAGGRLTYYNQHVVGTRVTQSGVTVEETTYDPHVRRQVEGGFEIETRATRVFNMNGWGGLSALQHVIEPRATYLMIRGYDQKGNPQYDRYIDRDRPRHAGHLLAHQSGQCEDGGAHGCRGGAVGGGARRALAGLRHRQGDLAPSSPSRTCRGSSSSTPTPSCASGPRPPTTCTGRGSARPTRTSRRATATWRSRWGRATTRSPAPTGWSAR